MWTEAHRARHDVRLKEIVSLNAVAEVARWLERVDPPRSGRATPYGAVVRAIAWHLRIGGPWRGVPAGGAHGGRGGCWGCVGFQKGGEKGLWPPVGGVPPRGPPGGWGRGAPPRLRISDPK